MPMEQNGLAKLLEEMGETSQVAGRLIGYPYLQTDWTVPHPDGTILLERLEEELGDLAGAIGFVTEKLGLDKTRILQRADKKRALFQRWDQEE